MKICTRLAALILLMSITVITPYGLAQNIPVGIDKSLDDNVGDHTKVHELLSKLQLSVARHDAAAVAALVHYPLKVNPGTKPLTLRTPKAFIASYDRIITPAIAAAIAKQTYEDLFVNFKGAMIGNGEVWITGICRDKACKQSDIKISTIQSTIPLKQ